MSQKTALITGGSRGLGRDMAINLAKDGVNVMFTYHSNLEKANEVVREVESLDQKAKAFQFDANDPNSTKSLMNQVTEYLQNENGSNHFDYLINNAGTGTLNMVVNTSDEQFNEMMNIHLKSVYFLTQKAIPYLNDGGRIVNISSGLARFSLPGMSAYAIMKGAIEVFTRYLAKELGEKNNGEYYCSWRHCNRVCWRQ